MKRHDMWGNGSPRKYFRLSSDSRNSEDASHNTALKSMLNTEFNTAIRKPVAHPQTYNIPSGFGNYSNQSRFSNSPPVLLPTPVVKTPKPGLLPTPGTVEASQYDRSATGPSTVNIIATTVNQSKNNPPSLHYQKLSDNCENSDFSKQQNINNKNESSGDLEVSPNISRYVTNLDEFLSSDTEIPVKISDSEELEVHSEPIPSTETTVNELENSKNDKEETGAKYNARYTGSVIDRKRYQSGAGYYEVLKLASENVKRQRRLSNQSNESGKHDGNQQRTYHKSGSTLKKKSLAYESPTKPPQLDTCIETHRKTEQLIISQEVQRRLDETGILKICLRKLNNFPEATEKSEIGLDVRKTSDICNKENNSERESLFEKMSIDMEKELSVEDREMSMDATDSIQTQLSLNSTPSPQKTTENTPSKERENAGLFERFRSPSVDVLPNNDEQSKTAGDSSSRDSSPKKIQKNKINLNLLKERFANTAFMKRKKLEESPSKKLDIQSNKEVITEKSVEVMPFSQEVENVPVDSMLSSDIVSQENLASEEVVMETDALHSEPEEEIKESDVINDGSDDVNLSSDDDDDLPEPSIFLGNSTRSEKPKCTEEKETSFSQDSLNDPEFENTVSEVQQNPPEPRRLKLTLDKMVQHKQDNQLKDAELSEISKELKEDMGTDWMVRATLESSADILPDHRKQLEKFAFPMDHLPDIYPGENVFNVDLLGEIFSFPSTLSLADCGFIPVKGKATDSLLWRASPDDLVGLVNSCLLVEAHLVRPCQNALMLWMFYLMSIHSSIHTIMQAFQTIWALMNNSIKFNQGRIWLPTVKQITRVLLNYGASFESLFPSPNLQPTFSMNDVINENGKGKENMVREGTCTSPKNQSSIPKKQFPIVGLNHVIKVITHGMHLRDMHKQSVFYSEEELKQLIGVICRAGLETQGREDTHGEDFMLCISSLLDAFSRSSWPSKCKDLCQSLPALCSHHHNLVHLVELFPSFTDRGRTLRRLLSYYAVHKLLSEDNPTGSVKIEKEMMSTEELKVCDLFPVLRSLRPNTDTNYYRLHSMISLVDTCIGNEPLPTDEQESLYKLVKELHHVSGEIRTSPIYPSRSKVKHVLQRISIKYNIMADNMVTKKVIYPACIGMFKITSSSKKDNLALSSRDSLTPSSLLESARDIDFEEYHSIVSYENELDIEIEQNRQQIQSVDEEIETEKHTVAIQKQELVIIEQSSPKKKGELQNQQVVLKELEMENKKINLEDKRDLQKQPVVLKDLEIKTEESMLEEKEQMQNRQLVLEELEIISEMAEVVAKLTKDIETKDSENIQLKIENDYENQNSDLLQKIILLENSHKKIISNWNYRERVTKREEQKSFAFSTKSTRDWEEMHSNNSSVESQYSSVCSVANQSSQFSSISSVGSKMESYQHSSSVTNSGSVSVNCSIENSSSSGCSTCSSSSDCSTCSSSSNCSTCSNSSDCSTCSSSSDCSTCSSSSDCSTCSSSDCSSGSESTSEDSPAGDFTVSSSWSVGKPCMDYYSGEYDSSQLPPNNKKVSFVVADAKSRRMLNFSNGKQISCNSICKDARRSNVELDVKNLGSQDLLDGSEVSLLSLPLSESTNSSSVETILSQDKEVDKQLKQRHCLQNSEEFEFSQGSVRSCSSVQDIFA